jgi:hypothetical protein
MDLDGDGRADLVWISSLVNGTHQWARNVYSRERFYEPNGTPFNGFKPIKGLQWSRKNMHIGDFNGDGLVDFYNSFSKVMYLNQRDGTFIEKSWGSSSVPQSGWPWDLNRDGLEDLVLSGQRLPVKGANIRLKSPPQMDELPIPCTPWV